MGVAVILTPTAMNDLKSIVQFIAADSPARAKAFGKRLVDCALSIGAFPEMGRVTPELADPHVRELSHGAYRIIYELRNNPPAVFVLRFWHGARGKPERGVDPTPRSTLPR